MFNTHTQNSITSFAGFLPTSNCIRRIRSQEFISTTRQVWIKNGRDYKGAMIYLESLLDGHMDITVLDQDVSHVESSVVICSNHVSVDYIKADILIVCGTTINIKACNVRDAIINVGTHTHVCNSDDVTCKVLYADTMERLYSLIKILSPKSVRKRISDGKQLIDRLETIYEDMFREETGRDITSDSLDEEIFVEPEITHAPYTSAELKEVQQYLNTSSNSTLIGILGSMDVKSPIGSSKKEYIVQILTMVKLQPHFRSVIEQSVSDSKSTEEQNDIDVGPIYQVVDNAEETTSVPEVSVDAGPDA